MLTYWLLICLSLSVTDHRIQSTPDFATEIVPALTRLGCNAGACHGAAAGRGNLHLSLFGSMPAADYEAIVHEFEGRRVNLTSPRRSLLLRKPTEEIEHGGGQRLDWDDADARMILNWLSAGAPPGKANHLASLRFLPDSTITLSPGETRAIRVEAIFADETVRDVTALTTFSILDSSAIALNDQFSLTAQRPGQHLLLARYMNRLISLRVITPPIQSSSLNSALTFGADGPAKSDSPIDQHVRDLLATLQLQPAPPADDFTWLRRVTLDLTGRIPTTADVLAFVASADPEKRATAVDRLLNSEAYVDYWTWRWAIVLKLRALPNEQASLTTYTQWLREQIRQDRPWDQTTQDLIIALGDTRKSGPANFHRMASNARGEAELVARAFAGLRLECANCHDHPLDRWTQQDYHGLASIFAPIERADIVRWNSGNQVTHPQTGVPAAPKIPGATERLNPREDHRLAVWRWLTAESDLWLARATVNRLWQALMGRGLVEPVDDLRDTNPASHPELLNWLAQEFANQNYQAKPLIRKIVLSQTYSQRSADVDSSSLQLDFFGYYRPRPLPPEIYVDALSDLLGLAAIEQPNVSLRAVTMIDGSLDLDEIDPLGRCRLGQECASAENVSASLAAQLHLLNGSLINRRLISQSNQLTAWLKSGLTTEQLISQSYLAGLGRHPTQAELNRWLPLLTADSDHEQRWLWEDFLWAMINSRPFRENR